MTAYGSTFWDVGEYGYDRTSFDFGEGHGQSGVGFTGDDSAHTYKVGVSVYCSGGGQKW